MLLGSKVQRNAVIITPIIGMHSTVWSSGVSYQCFPCPRPFKWLRQSWLPKSNPFPISGRFSITYRLNHNSTELSGLESYSFWLRWCFLSDLDIMLRLYRAIPWTNYIGLTILRMATALNKSPHPRQCCAWNGGKLIYIRPEFWGFAFFFN